MDVLLDDRTADCPPVIAVVDDDAEDRSILAEELHGWGYQSVTLDGSYSNVASLVQEITSKQSNFVICDNHLKHAGYARFSGIEAVSELHKLHIPSILITQYQDTDDMLLKLSRIDLPVVLDKGDLDQEQVGQALEKCHAELDGNPASDRRPHRVLVTVDSHNSSRVVVFVDAWNPHEAVAFPTELLGCLSAHLSEGLQLLAEINIGATHSRELFFTNFELAPELNPHDGLA